jgi:hypothetical protein
MRQILAALRSENSFRSTVLLCKSSHEYRDIFTSMWDWYEDRRENLDDMQRRVLNDINSDHIESVWTIFGSKRKK